MTVVQAHPFDLPNSFTREQEDLIRKTAAYEQASLAANTRRSYAAMWKKFETWCRENGCAFMPTSAETIALFLGSIGSSVSFSTLDSAIAAIEKAHEKAGVSIAGDKDIYRRVRKGIRRTHKEKQAIRQAKALSVEDLASVCKEMGSTLKALRDRALITVSFFGALRRSEAIALDFDYVEVTKDGLVLTLLQTKTSDTAVRIYISPAKDPNICPVRSLNAWLASSRITRGPIFRPVLKGGKLSTQRLTGHAVSVIMKGLFGQEHAGHSLRRGLATAAAEAGASIARIQQHTRHKSADMVLRYCERVNGFENSSAKTLGL